GMETVIDAGGQGPVLERGAGERDTAEDVRHEAADLEAEACSGRPAVVDPEVVGEDFGLGAVVCQIDLEPANNVVTEVEVVTGGDAELVALVVFLKRGDFEVVVGGGQRARGIAAEDTDIEAVPMGSVMRSGRCGRVNDEVGS